MDSKRERFVVFSRANNRLESVIGQKWPKQWPPVCRMVRSFHFQQKGQNSTCLASAYKSHGTELWFSNFIAHSRSFSWPQEVEGTTEHFERNRISFRWTYLFVTLRYHINPPPLGPVQNSVLPVGQFLIASNVPRDFSLNRSLAERVRKVEMLIFFLEFSRITCEIDFLEQKTCRNLFFLSVRWIQ